VASLQTTNAHNGALVAIRPATGEILAMVGSPVSMMKITPAG
jgi:cell division protein FtsI/penicillin-binding protein 2